MYNKTDLNETEIGWFVLGIEVEGWVNSGEIFDGMGSSEKAIL
jgi:hypothetical protein